jgi:hypothetical protein
VEVVSRHLSGFLLSAFIVAALGFGTASVSSAVPASVRVLVVKETWGPQPFTAADVDNVMKAASQFYATASFDQVTLSYDQTPWLTTLSGAPACNDQTSALALPGKLAALASDAGYSQVGYDRVLFVFPASNCAFRGVFDTGGILLNGLFNEGIVVHELGHSFGMGHAGAFVCHFTSSTTRFCRSDVYGDPWDVMGADADTAVSTMPVGDFGALQKARAGWLTDLGTVSVPGTYRLAALEETAPTAPRALVIKTASFEYWIDHREPTANDSYLVGPPRADVVSGFEVHRALPGLLSSRPNFPVAADWLLPRGKKNLYFTPPGATLSLPGLFAVTGLSVSGGVVTIRFRWLDRTHPSAPTVTTLQPTVTAGAPLVIQWKPSHDSGTGVARYLVTLDHGTATSLAASPTTPLTAALTPTSPGAHTVSIVALDYAGNRSLPTIRHFIVH